LVPGLALLQLRPTAALDLVALVAHTDAALVIAEVVDAAVDVFVDYGTRLQEGLLDVLGSLRGSFHEDEAVFARKHLSLIRADLASGIQITLVSNEHNRHVRVSILLHFFKPAGQMRERVSPRDVVDEQGASCAAIVRASDALK